MEDKNEPMAFVDDSEEEVQNDIEEIVAFAFKTNGEVIVLNEVELEDKVYPSPDSLMNYTYGIQSIIDMIKAEFNLSRLLPQMLKQMQNKSNIIT